MKLLAAMIFLLSSIHSHAATIDASYRIDFESRKFNCGGCKVQVALSLATVDNWDTAFIDYEVIMNSGGAGDMFMSGGVGDLNAFSSFDDLGMTLLTSFGHFSTLTKGDKLVTQISNGNGPVWDILSNGLFFTQAYAGFEYINSATITLTDRSNWSHRFRLWGDEPSIEIVPIPASITGIVFAGLALFGVARARDYRL